MARTSDLASSLTRGTGIWLLPWGLAGTVMQSQDGGSVCVLVGAGGRAGEARPSLEAQWQRTHVRGIWPEDVLKKDSRGLSWVAAGNPGFHRLVPVTSGSFSACL